MPTYTIQDFTDQYGMITDVPNVPSGNGILFTAHYVWGLAASGQLTDDKKKILIQVFRNNFVESGLMRRNPAKISDYEAHDDYLGLMGADSFLGVGFAQEILRYGKETACDGVDESDASKLNTNKIAYAILKVLKLGKVHWVWNNVNPGKFHVNPWLGRRLDVTGTMKMAANQPICPILWLYWSLFMLSLLLFGSDNDGYILRTHMALACEKYGFLTKLVCKAVRWKMKKKFGGMGQLLSAYFNNPDHPLVALLKDVY
jgi:hypothetical protein